MLTALERDEFLRDRDRAFATLDHGDYDTFMALYQQAGERTRARLDEIRAQALRDHDATHYDDAARFCIELTHAFHQRRRAYRGITEAAPVQVQASWSAVLHPLPVILAVVERGDVAMVEVNDRGVDAATGDTMLSVDVRLRPEAERALTAEQRPRNGIPMGLGLRRALPDEAMDDLTRRLRRDPTTPTRAEVAELLHAVEAYNASHNPPIAVSGAL